MGNIYITEYSRVGTVDHGGGIQAGMEPPLADQVVNYSATSTDSSNFNQDTRVIRVHTDAVCHVDIGSAPNATTTKRRMAADQTEFFSIPNNSTFKLAAIDG